MDRWEWEFPFFKKKKSINFPFHIFGAGSCPESRHRPASLIMKDSGCVLSLPFNSLWRKGKKRREGGGRRDTHRKTEQEK